MFRLIATEVRVRARSLTAALCAALTLLAGPAAALEIRASVALPSHHPVVAAGWERFQGEVAEQAGSKLTFRLFVDGAMVPSARTLKALERGEVDMAFLATPEYPDEFPYAAFIAAFSMISKEGLAAAAAVTDLVLLRCTACREEFARRNLIFLGTYSAAPYLLMGREAMSSGSSLAGRRVWSPGTPWDGSLRALSASPTRTENAPSEALATGAADAVIDVPMALRQPRLAQQVKAVTLLPLGGYRGASPFTLNRDFWRKMTPYQRSVLLAAAPAGLVAATIAYEDDAQNALRDAETRGVHLQPADESLTGLVESAADQTLRRFGASIEARLGVSDGAELIAAYRELYAKYIRLLGQAPVFEDAVEILRREIFSKLDPASFGLESVSLAGTGSAPANAQ